MKKIICLVIALVLTLTFCGCKNTDKDFSSANVEVVVEEIVVDNTSTQSQDTVNSDVTSGVISESITTDTSSNSDNIAIDYNTIVEVDLCGEIVRSYLNAKDANNQYYWLSTYKGQRFDQQHISLEWKSDTSFDYTVYFSENSDFSNPIIVKTTVNKDLRASTLYPGKTYYWKAVSGATGDVLGGGRIKTTDAPGRFIYIEGIKNVRDMGGWKTESGKKVKYGMLYRGAQLNTEKDNQIVNSVTEAGLETFNSLGIKTEFDIRSDSNVHTKAEGINLNHVHVANHTSYGSIFSSTVKDTVVSNYQTMFSYLSDSSNYPIYTNCQGGADRTGTYAFLLNGLLGVSYEDLTRDFELTSFSGTTRWRSVGNGGMFNTSDADYVDGTVTVSYRALYNGMMEYGAKNGCATLQQSIEHWLINYIGVPKSQIDSFKSIMLE